MAEPQKTYIPAEWAPHKALWCAWPSDPELWPGNLLARAREEIAAMLRFMAEGEPVKLLVNGKEAEQSAKDMLGDCSAVEIIPAKFGDIWLRDTGPIWSPQGALRFRVNGWGGKYVYDGDDEVGDFIAQRSGQPIARHDFVLEGGAVDHNGQGTILTTRQCMLNPNRNPLWDQAEAERALKRVFGAERICWLGDGLLNDHTDGHVDNLARFIGENTVCCPRADRNDDPNTKLFDETKRYLCDYGFKVVEIPSVGRVYDDLSGDIAPASHMNFIIGNKTIAVPTYGTDTGDEAVRVLKNIFPNHRVKGFSSSAILTGGGSFHCITQQEPEL